MTAAPSHDTAALRDRVEHGLLPIVRIAGRDTSWTIGERLAHYRCPGTSVAVMKDGRIDWVGGYGHLDADGRGGSADAAGHRSLDPCGPDTIYMVASCSKPLAALIVLQQVERGVLDLDTPVNAYLRRWQVPDNDLTAANPVTLRRCLSHTAGLTVNGWGVVPRDGSPVPSVIDLLEGRPPSKMPAVVVDRPYDGTNRYSGGGYLIAQLVVEDVLGRDFADVADEMVFGPLGMTRSTYRHPLPAAFHHDVASGHGDSGHPAPGGWMLSPEKAAGGLFSTARDYAAFLLAVRAAVRGEPNAVLGQSLAHEMVTRHDRSAFGLGFRVLGDGPTHRINHGGSNDGYQSETDLYLESGDGAVVLTNATSGLLLFREVLNGIADAYGWPGYMPEPKQLATLSDDDLQRYAGEYRIVAGIEMPLIRVWAEGGRLFNEVPGLRFGVQEAFCDVRGVLFSQTGPFETHVEFGPDGRAAEMTVKEGDVVVLRAVRAG
ncbi:MAG: serine hydrolase domain-containing protein [Ilumatobacteraceae bacterium]